MRPLGCALLLVVSACECVRSLPDGGALADAGPTADAAVFDAGIEDAGAPDAGPRDAGPANTCWSVPERVSGAESVGFVDAALDGEGRLTVAWTQSSPPPGVGEDVYARRQLGDGGWSAIEHVHYIDATVVGPHLAVSRGGARAIGWLDVLAGSAFGHTLRVARWAPDADAWRAAEVVSQPTTRFKNDLVLGADDRGDFVAMWTTERDAGVGASLWFSRFDDATGAWSPEEALDAPAFQQGATELKLALNGAGQLVLAYRYTNASQNDEVRARTWRLDAGWEETLLGGRPFSPSAPRLALDESGDALVAWNQEPLNGNGSARRVVARRLERGRWSDEEPVDLADSGFVYDGPAVSTGADGGFWAAWSTQDRRVLLSRRGAAGWSAPLDLGHALAEVPFSVVVAANARDEGAVAWMSNLRTAAVQLERGAAPSGVGAVNEGFGADSFWLRLRVAAEGTRWLVLHGRGPDSYGVFVSHCP